MRGWGRLGRIATWIFSGASIGFLLAVAFRGGWDVADPLASVLGATAGVLALLWTVLMGGRQFPEAEHVATELARQVVRVEQTQFAQLLGGDVSALIDLEFNSRIHGKVVSTETAGSLDRIAEFYRQLTPGRMVITGSSEAGTQRDAGTGKTLSSLALILGLIKSREPGEPVPVRLSAPSWPGHDIDSWLRFHLVEVWHMRPKEIQALLDAQLILPIIDGLDELDATDTPGHDSRAAALLAEVNAYQHGIDRAPVVITCRWPHYRALGEQDSQARTVAVVELKPVSPVKARTYLEYRVAETDSGQLRWQPVFNALSPAPGTVLTPAEISAAPALREALDTPWRLTLVATVYQERTPAGDYCRDPRDLLQLALSGSIREHLFDHYVPASLAGLRRLSQRVPKSDEAQRYLARLARYLNGNRSEAPIRGRNLSSTDLVLHELWPFAGRRRAPYMQKFLCLLLSAIFAGTYAAVAWLSGAEKDALLLAAMFALPVIVLLFQVDSLWSRPRRINLRALRTFRGLSDLFGSLIVTLLLVALMSLLSDLRSAVQQASIMAICIASGLFGELGGWLFMQDREPVSDPRKPLHADAFLISVVAMTFVLVSLLSSAFGGGYLEWVVNATVYGLAFASITASARYLAFLSCARRELPWRLGRFLHLCYEAGILRIAGNAYQFRHRELQEHLASGSRGVSGRSLARSG